MGEHTVRPLRYSINVTLDGCCDHRVGNPDEESNRYWAAQLARADALLFGRVTYEMMEGAWRKPATGTWPDWMADWMIPFAETIDGAKKYVVSSTLDRVDWNAELVRGDLGEAVQQLKRESGKGLFTGGVRRPQLALPANQESPMAETKTKPTDASVDAYLASKASPEQLADCKAIMAMCKRVTKQQPKMWGPSIVGYGSYNYRYESGHSGDACLTGFAVRGKELVVYLIA